MISIPTMPSHLRLLLLTFLFAVPVFSVRREVLSTKFINSINQKKTSWIAGRNFPEDTPLEDLRRIASGVLDEGVPIGITLLPYREIDIDDLPESFDAREEWPFCESSREIRNQGACGSCWAFGTTEAMTDRLCIQSNGTIKFEFSPEDLLTCCGSCGSCAGGNTLKAWNYWISDGLVSGGDVNSNLGCQPYSPLAYKEGKTPECLRSCELDYPDSYQIDKHYGESVYLLPETDIAQIQYEIMVNGPVAASYKVYEDFYNYKSGVYVYTEGEYVGSHAIKILGWGVENDLPYWLVANSWGARWGDKGFFKILRGDNHMGIEHKIYAGTPRIA